MRIAFISYEFPPDTGKGGIGTYIKQTATSIGNSGWEVHVFAGSNKETATKKIDNYFLHSILCNDPYDFAIKVVSPFEIEHNVKTFDIIESPEIHGNALYIKKKFPAIPLVVRLHAPNYLVEHLKKKYIKLSAKLRFVAGSVRRLKFDLGYWRPYNKLADADYQFIQLADGITAPSESMKQWAVKNWTIRPGKIKVIPNIFVAPISLSQMAIPVNNDFKRIVFFGRLNVLKGLVNASISMNKILKENPGWRFRVIGDDGPGPKNNISMKKWMMRNLHKVLNRVEFIDGLDYEKLPAAINDCEVVLLPSLFESFSYTCAEAMAAGKAVVGSNNGGMADLIQDGKSGVLVNPENETDIYVALKKIISDNEFRYSLSVQARKRITEELDSNKISSRLDAYYKSMIA